MSASSHVDGTGTGGVAQVEPSVPASDGIEGGASAERLLLFTDAVTAISITLLILPLVDLVPEATAEHKGAAEVFSGHLDQIWSFLLSFAVVANIWLEHHRAFSMVSKLNRSLTVWNMGWLLSVVVLPLPTEMTGAFGRDRFAAGFYYLTLLASMVCRAAMLKILKTNPGLLESDDEKSRQKIDTAFTDSYLNVAAVAVAFVIALAVPVLQYWSLALLVIPGRRAQFQKWRAAR